MSNNLNLPAFPLDADVKLNDVGRGFSKLEYAAIHIVAGMYGSGRYAPNQNEALAEIAVSIAKLTIQKCNE